jgi:hypothetical protein
MTAHSQKAVKEANQMAIRAFFSSHLCATNRECAEALGLNVCVVGRHVKSIRAEWKDARALAAHVGEGENDGE